MLASRSVVYLTLVSVVMGAMLVGCPMLPPALVPAFIIEPGELDFGSSENVLTFQVSKNFTSESATPFAIEAQQPWIHVDPIEGASEGPTDATTVTVTIERSLLNAGVNRGAVVISSPGVVPGEVSIQATMAIVADFRADRTRVTRGETVTFTDMSQVAVSGESIVQWEWDFGDGTDPLVVTDGATPVQHAYDLPGNYTVSLTITTNTGAADTAAKPAYINVRAVEPVANFGVVPLAPYAGEVVQFTDQSDPGSADAIDSWLWDFGDGTTSTLQNPTHTYAVSSPPVDKEYTVTLTVTTQIGTSTYEDTVQEELLVRAKMPPEADFAASDRTPLVNTAVQFSDLSVAGTAPITEWLWNFGDGDTSDLRNPTHIYTTVGAFDVTLTVTSAHGSDTELKQGYIEVDALAPAADFTANPRATFVGDEVQFTDQSTAGSTPIISWLWSFGDGATSHLQNPQHIYRAAGAYTVSLTVRTTYRFDVETKVGYIQVLVKEPPAADFTVSNQNPPVNTAVQFTDLSDPGTGTISSWLWDFGDGGTSAAQNPTHTYVDQGPFTVSLTVTTQHGSDTETKPDYVETQVTPPVADFSASNVNPHVNEDVLFTDLSDPGTAPITEWLWEFGDGETSGEQNPAHSYADSGPYTVTLTVRTRHGEDSITKDRIIAPTGLPRADFSVSNTTPDISEIVQFTDESREGLAPITNWVWDFGDGFMSAAQNPTHIFVTSGTFTVSLTVVNAFGEDTLTRQAYITVGPRGPVADFMVSDPYPDVDEEFRLIDLSSPGSAPITTWEWFVWPYDFEEDPECLTVPDDALLGNGPEVVLALDDEGPWNVLLRITTKYGSDSIRKCGFINVGGPPLPSVDFLADNKTPVAGLSIVQFTDLSWTIFPQGGVITTWSWSFGDDTTSNEQNPTHVYAEPGAYDVTLLVTAELSDGRTVENAVTKIAYILAREATALDEYIHAFDPTYGFDLASVIEREGYKVYVLDMTSQTSVIVPDNLANTVALLFVNDGDISMPAPTAMNENLVQFALETGSMVIDLTQVPNQPMTFLDDGVPRSNDELVAYTLDKFLLTGDRFWPLLFPMTKSIVRAMDSVQSFMAGDLGIPLTAVDIERFAVAGGANQAWAAYLAAAIDPRVVGLMPMAFDALNLDVQMDHQLALYAGYLGALDPYSLLPPAGFDILSRLSTPEGQSLLDLVDPYRYAILLRVPKYIVGSASDPYWAPDSGDFYLSALPGTTRFRLHANVGHDLLGTYEETLLEGLWWYKFSVLSGNLLPTLSWSNPETGEMTVSASGGTNGQLYLWAAFNPTAPYFDVDSFGPNWVRVALSQNTIRFEPQDGYLAFMIEYEFQLFGEPGTVTTTVEIIPPRASKVLEGGVAGVSKDLVVSK